jgi:TatD DNase family protein
MTYKLFDSHAHYYDGRFDEVEGGANALLDCLFDGEVGGVVNVGTDLENAHAVIESAARFEKMYAAVGIHPSDGQGYRDIPAAMAELRAILGDAQSRRAQKIVALGEIGLDYHYPDTDKPHQAAFFEAQLQLAEELDIPVIIHDREAHGDCFDAVCAHPNVRGVFHSYSGSAEMARDLVRRGWYISFSGVVTFKNAPKVREAVEAVPLDRILIETDAPYLAPVPHRGKMNHSGYMLHTAEAVAAVKSIDTDTAIRMTAENAKRLFGL